MRYINYSYLLKDKLSFISTIKYTLLRVIPSIIAFRYNKKNL